MLDIRYRADILTLSTTHRREQMARRIYAVTAAGQVRLVEAISRAHAIGHVVADTIEARVPTQHELVATLQAGVQLERAADPVKRGDAA